ncbi:VOC family protein [Mucilaginibacter antarcticus]|uniref:VOC family protein n=1 Tax=Mucilaginibacter antarcticus TaxID=1855725 RepID=A0ABW5XVB2_9SPHI
MKPKQIWANLAVKDVARTREFYTAIGFTSNEGDSKSNELCSFKIGESGFVVNIFSYQHFKDVAKDATPNLTGNNEVMFTLWADSRAEADAWATEVSQAGGTLLTQPTAFGPGYYGFDFADPDGHRWNVFNM